MWGGWEKDANGQHNTFSSPNLGFTPTCWTSIQFTGFPISTGFSYDYIVTGEDDKADFLFHARHLPPSQPPHSLLPPLIISKEFTSFIQHYHRNYFLPHHNHRVYFLPLSLSQNLLPPLLTTLEFTSSPLHYQNVYFRLSSLAHSLFPPLIIITLGPHHRLTVYFLFSYHYYTVYFLSHHYHTVYFLPSSLPQGFIPQPINTTQFTTSLITTTQGLQHYLAINFLLSSLSHSLLPPLIMTTQGLFPPVHYHTVYFLH